VTGAAAAVLAGVVGLSAVLAVQARANLALADKNTALLAANAKIAARYNLAVDAIKDISAGGHFFGSSHTLARYERAFYRPLLSDWSNFENWRDAGSRNATERATIIWKKVLSEYSPPPLDEGVREAIAAYVARRSGELGNAA